MVTFLLHIFLVWLCRKRYRRKNRYASLLFLEQNFLRVYTKIKVEKLFTYTIAGRGRGAKEARR